MEKKENNDGWKKQVEREKNDRMSGRGLFTSYASLFVDDVEAYEQYQRHEENQQEAVVSTLKQNAKDEDPKNK